MIVRTSTHLNGKLSNLSFNTHKIVWKKKKKKNLTNERIERPKKKIKKYVQFSRAPLSSKLSLTYNLEIGNPGKLETQTS